MPAELELVEKRLGNLEKIMSGNGNPDSGMCVRVALMSQQLDNLTVLIVDIKKSLDKKKDSNTKVTVAMIGAIVAVIITVIPLIL